MSVLAPIPNVDRYAPAVTTHYPGECGLSLTLRCDLMAYRDRATIGLTRCCDEAVPALREAERLAQLACLAGTSPRALAHMNFAVRSLIEAAQNIEAACKLAGGNDARG